MKGKQMSANLSKMSGAQSLRARKRGLTALSAYIFTKPLRRVMCFAVCVVCITIAWSATRANLEKDYSLAPDSENADWRFGWKKALFSEFFPYRIDSKQIYGVAESCFNRWSDDCKRTVAIVVPRS
jgi:hypothetical protein